MPRIKRKYDNTPPTLNEGIPVVKRFGVSETGPSIPKEKDHAAVKHIEVKDFGLLGEDTYSEIKDYPTGFNLSKGVISYVTENDIAGSVRAYLVSIIAAMGLDGEIEVYSEIGVFKLRPDLWVLTVRSMPIGVVEVKKPDKINQTVSGMNHPNVLGELYDFMQHLPNFYGVTPAFGILTNLNSWRIAWLPDENTDAIAASVEEVEEESDPPSDPGTSTGTSELPSHQLLEDIDTETEGEDQDPSEDEDKSTSRSLHVSRVFDRDGPRGELPRALASVLMKMLKAKRTPFAHPFDQLESRSILKFVKGDEGVLWTRLALKNGPQWNKVAAPKKFLYAIQDMGYGSHGRVWLTCSSSGAVCVLKFSLFGNAPPLDAEAVVWGKVYPQFPVFRETWCGEPSLRMPHFAAVTELEKNADTAELVRQSLLRDYHSNALVHGDVAWRNIGIYKLADGLPAVVVFDMGDVRELNDNEDTGWVDTAVDKLLLLRIF